MCILTALFKIYEKVLFDQMYEKLGTSLSSSPFCSSILNLCIYCQMKNKNYELEPYKNSTVSEGFFDFFDCSI